MGMYTQVRGCLDIGEFDLDNYSEYAERLTKAQEEFKADCEKEEDSCYRSWVCEYTHLHLGGNGTVFLFFGVELKNYNEEAEAWIAFVLEYFPRAEGTIFFHTESGGGWRAVIRNGKVIENTSV